MLRSGLTAGPQRAPGGLHLGPFWELFFGRFSDTFSVEFREPFRERSGAVLEAFWDRFRSFFRRCRRSEAVQRVFKFYYKHISFFDGFADRDAVFFGVFL